MTKPTSSPLREGGRFVYDIETNGLLDDLTTIHSLVVYDLDTETLHSFRNDGHPDNAERMLAAVQALAKAEKRVGHNIINFDEPALKKLFPWFPANEVGVVTDTIILTRLIWPNVADSDRYRVKRQQLDGRLIGSHSLEAWGQRIGEWKGDYAKETAAKFIEQGMDKADAAKAVWANWSQAMQDYCDQDVIANLKLYRHCQRKGYAGKAVRDEMEMAILCHRMEENGFNFDERKAGDLYGKLAGARARLEDALKETFGSWVVPGPVVTPKAPNSANGYHGRVFYVQVRFGLPDEEVELPPEAFTPKGNVRKKYLDDHGLERRFEGYPFSKITITEFNPASRLHIADRLQKLYGWKPQEFTPDGRPKVDEDVMAALPFECAPLLTEYFTAIKRLGQLAEGRQAWLKLVRDGKIKGRYNSVGAVTRRATHSSPNIGQVPGVGADYGEECRELFGPPPGWLQVGTDASGLELRCLAHYMARWDGGAYGEVILNGDIHTVNQKAAGLPTRNNAKTFIYGFLYGAGDGKIGEIVGGTAADGKRLRAKFLAELPALGSLVDAVKTKARAHKHLLALDGGVLHVRSDHAALNTLLQSAGALICKKWGTLIERELQRRGLHHGNDYLLMGWIHDEYQHAARTPEIADQIVDACRVAIKQTEEYYEFRMPLDCESKIGRNWAECH